MCERQVKMYSHNTREKKSVSSDEEIEGEQLLQRNELAKQDFFRKLGGLYGLPINDPEITKVDTVKKKTPFKRITSNELKEPVRKSSRLSKLSSKNLHQNNLENVPDTCRKFFLGAEQMIRINDESEDLKPLLQDLIPYFKETHTCVSVASIQKSLDDYKKSLKHYNILPENVKKVGTSMIYSLLIHPSESKLIIMTGDEIGCLSFWDVDNQNSEVEMYRPHKNPIYCMNVCSYNPLKLYATAIDGVVRSCDLEKMEFCDVYVSQPENHTQYHAQMSPHILLVAHECGNVGVIDIRDRKNPSRWIKCHVRSVETIQQNPRNENEFVTSSAVKEVCLWDIRKNKTKKPLLLLPHPKSPKSAFFSPGGDMLLTSCYDDRIRVYASDKNHLMMTVNHNMYTGQWLRPFHAKWHPCRDDVFVIGSMNYPREVNVYGIHGLPLHSLKSPNLTTILSNCEFHRSLPFIAGVNNKGYVHVFKGPDYK